MTKLQYSLVIFGALIAALGIFLYKGDLSATYVDAKYSNDKSQFFTMANGARVHYRDQGNNQKPTVVLVHGSNASLHTWEPWVAILKANYRIITMDLPAHGLTGATPDNDYSSQAQVNTVNALVKHLNVDNFTLGGNSMGGGVTWRYTLQYPSKVNAMMLIDSGGLPQFNRQEIAKAGEDKKDAPLFFTLMKYPLVRMLSRYVDPYWLTKQGVTSAYNNSPMVTDTLINRYYELALREGSRKATLSRFDGYQSTAAKPVDTTLFKVPTLIMWGKEDSLIPYSVAHQFDQALTNTRLVIYDGVGHIPMEEIPAKSAQDILAFLTTIKTNTIATAPSVDMTTEIATP